MGIVLIQMGSYALMKPSTSSVLSHTFVYLPVLPILKLLGKAHIYKYAHS